MRKWLVVVALLVAACSQEPSSTPESCGAEDEPEAEAEAGEQEADAGVLAGKISFDGTPPPPRVIQVNKDEQACGSASGQKVFDVVVGDDGGLAGCVIEINGLKGDFTHPADGYNLRQKGCRFIPHFQVIPHNSELVVHNDDPVMHNVNTGSWNFAQVGGAKPYKKLIRFRGQPLVRVNCNVHSWMEAWLYVVRSPYFVVTDKNGAYRLADVPAGKYKVSFTHPALGTKTARLEITSGQTTTHDLVYKK